METKKEYTKEELQAILDKLTDSIESTVRIALVELGYKLDTFVEDDNYEVREAVATHAGKYGRNDLVERLVEDSDYWLSLIHI